MAVCNWKCIGGGFSYFWEFDPCPILDCRAPQAPQGPNAECLWSNFTEPDIPPSCNCCGKKQGDGKHNCFWVEAFVFPPFSPFKGRPCMFLPVFKSKKRWNWRQSCFWVKARKEDGKHVLPEAPFPAVSYAQGIIWCQWYHCMIWKDFWLFFFYSFACFL